MEMSLTAELRKIKCSMVTLLLYSSREPKADSTGGSTKPNTHTLGMEEGE